LNDDRQRALLTDPVGPAILAMAWPMLVGILAIVLFNVVDTFWVGQLGARELAAMSYTFPVVMVVMSVSMGIGLGTTAVVARAIGHGDRGKVRRLTTDALVLANGMVVLVALLGLATIDPLFALLGAEPATVALVREYMVPWYLGVGLLVIPMVGNSALRATGDTKTPSVIMLVAGLVNAVLDPLLIFGAGPVPSMGLAGAAWATVGSYAGAFAAAMWVLVRRERLLTFARPRLAEVYDSWRRILHIGLPAAGTNLLAPLSAGILTRLVSSYGPTAVAAFGVGTRLEGFAMVGIGALSTAMTPMVAQNLGAGRLRRIHQAVSFGTRAGLVWGAGAALLLAMLAGPIAHVFSDDPAVVEVARTYLLVVPFSYGALGLAQIVGTTFNALDEPLAAAGLVAVRLLALTLPLAWLGTSLAGLDGLFGGIAAANLAIGLLAWAVVRVRLRRLDADDARLPAVTAAIGAPATAAE
jgi:putative MATE family efflux protein